MTYGDCLNGHDGPAISECHVSAGVVKLVDAGDSKSPEVHASCRFDSDLRHHLTLSHQTLKLSTTA